MWTEGVWGGSHVTHLRLSGFVQINGEPCTSQVRSQVARDRAESIEVTKKGPKTMIVARREIRSQEHEIIRQGIWV